MMNVPLIYDVDQLLFDISINDDKIAYQKLFKLYYIPLCLFAKRFIDNKETREDIVQDVFVSIWDKRKMLDINSSAKNYLITSVRNNCLNYLRKEGYIQDYRNNIIENPPSYSVNVDELYNQQELMELLEKTLTTLPEEYRIAFKMSRMENKASDEIANKLGVSVRTVERYRNRALEILKNELKDFLPFSLITLLLKL